jgi:cytochrome c oxidase cbb3-type subunit 3
MLGELQNSLDDVAGRRNRTASLPTACRELAHSRKGVGNLHFLRIAGILLAVAATTTASSSQTPNTPNSSRQIIRSEGKKLFETRCAVCHGLDGGGGEHAPDIARASSEKSRSDRELFHIIHDGLVTKGMPSFSSIDDEKIRAVVAHLRFLQGKTATRAASGDPVHGKELFRGKGGCADCHAMSGYGRFVSTDLTDFAVNHDANEIRDAILKPGRAEDLGQTAAAVTTISGDRFSGLIRNENNSSLQIQDAEGRFYLFVKSSLRSIERSTAPSMPANYQQELSTKEIEDLVSYIVHQTSTPETTGGGHSARRPAAQIE